MTAYVELPSGTVLATDRPDIWPEAKRLSRKAGKEKLRAEAFKRLHEILKPGDTVRGIVRHVSRSGMSRQIDFYAISGSEPLCISGYMAELMDYRQSKDGALVVGGCGMDMIFATVYNLGATLWPNGTLEPHGRRNGEPDSSGGYALKSGQL